MTAVLAAPSDVRAPTCCSDERRAVSEGMPRVANGVGHKHHEDTVLETLSCLVLLTMTCLAFVAMLSPTHWPNRTCSPRRKQPWVLQIDALGKHSGSSSISSSRRLDLVPKEPTDLTSPITPPCHSY